MPYTPAQNRATQKYHKEHMEQLTIRAQKGFREKVAQHIEITGESQAEFFRRAIAETISRDRARIRETMKNAPKEPTEEE